MSHYKSTLTLPFTFYKGVINEKKKREFPKGKSEIFKAKGEIRGTRTHEGRN